MKATLFPPTTHIKDYFGEKIGMYFSFFSHVTIWFLTPGLIGAICFALELKYGVRHTAY